MNTALQEYTEKVKSGEIEKPKPDDPITKARKNPQSLRAAINGKCFDCSGASRQEVKHCPVEDCPLYPVRPWQ